MSVIRNQLFWGIIYTGLARYLGILISLSVTAVLARILLPSEFGIVAIATVFINFFSSLTVAGFGPAIVQNSSIDKRDIESIFVFTFYLGLALALLFIAAAPLIASFYDHAELLETICFILSVNIFFAIITIVPNSLLFKAKEFKYISVRSIIIQLAIGVISVIAALNGWGVYALLINPVLGSSLIFFASITKKPILFKFSFQWNSVRKILSFSAYQLLFNFVFITYRSIDKMWIGKSFNMNALGYYEKSYRLMMLPLENISGVINPVLHPILSDFQHDPAFIFASYRKLIRILAEIGFLLSVFLFFTSSELILLFFGPQWKSSVDVFQILSLSVGIQIVQSPIAAIFQSLNKMKGLFVASIVVLIFIVIAISLGVYQHNLNMLALYLVIAFWLAYLTYNFVLCYLAEMSFGVLLKSLFRPMALALGLILVLGMYSYFFSITNMLASLIVKAVISLLYVLILLKSGELTNWPIPQKIKSILKIRLK